MGRIVLVHGAFGGAWCWEPLVPLLERAGHRVQAFDLPGSGADPTPAGEVTLEAYAERVRRALEEDPEPAVLVGHSMGGIVVTQAAARCPERVAMLVYLAAFVPGEGESLLTLVGLPEGAGDGVQANMIVGGDPPAATMPADAAREVLYGCCSEERATWAISKLGPQALAPMSEPVALRDALERIPRGYVFCTRDLAILPALQERMAGQGGCLTLARLDTDHSLLAVTEELAELLAGLAGRLVSGAPAGSG